MLGRSRSIRSSTTASTSTVVLIVIGKTIAVVRAAARRRCMLYIWFLRKVIADMQNRIGPNRAGPFGLLQTLADGIKLFFKEQSMPDDRRPAGLPARAVPRRSCPRSSRSAIVPDRRRGRRSPGTRRTSSSPTSPIGVLWLLAMSGLGLYGVMLAGWSSGSKYPLLGSVRASAQLLSYEAAFGLAIVGVLVQAGHALDARHRRRSRRGTSWDSIVNGDWYWLPRDRARSCIFLIAAIAETNHPPFDLVEAEQELVGGFHTEYTGIRFAIFFLAEFMNVITMSAIAVTLFLGGPSGPALGFLAADGWFNVWVMPVVLVHVQGARPAVRAPCGCARRCRACATTSSWRSAGSSSSRSPSSG